MKALFLRRTAFLFLLFRALPGITAAEADSPEKTGEEPLFSWNLLWAGSWYNNFKTPGDDSFKAEDIFSGGTLFNRGDFRLVLPKADLSFRFLATDKRLLPPGEENPKAGFNPGFGAYHNGSGSRFLYGVQNEYGLPARIRHIWLRSAPFAESRGPSLRDLKNDASAPDKAESYLYLALPPVSALGAFASAALDGELNPALGGGIGYYGTKTNLWLEGFYTQKKLAPRKASSWFSPAPPLPERDFKIHALGLMFNSPAAGFATDWAWSETFAWGRGIFGNCALRLGNRFWRFSLAGDGAGGRFTDRDGDITGTGLRLAARGEHLWPRSGLLRLEGVFRSPAAGEAFERGSLSLYFRPAAPGAKEAAHLPFRFSRARLDFSRDARTPKKTGDTLDALFGFRAGFFSGAFSCGLKSFSARDSAEGISPLFRPRAFETFESFKISGELGRRAGIFDLKTRLGYTIMAEKENPWDISLNVSVKPGGWGRLGLKIASADFPEKWNYTLSWRFDSRFFRARPPK